MQSNSFFSGYNYSTLDSNSEANRSVWPVKDTDVILTSMNGAFSFSYRDIYLRHFKEMLKQTMLKHEAVFEDQIRELHRLYWRQKELMVEMERLYLNPGLSQTSSQHNPRECHTTNTLWLNPCISTSKMCILPHEHTSVRIPELSASEDEKPGKLVLDLEFPPCEYLDIGEEGSLQEGKAHEIETSTRNITLVSDFHSNDLHHSTSCVSKLKLVLDLNQPVETEETSDLELNCFQDPITSIQAMPSAIVEESHPQNDAGAAENGPQEINKVQVQLSSKICQAENGIDLNTSPPLCEELSIHNESKQTQESLSVSLHGKHGLAWSSKVVQALPCFNGIAFSRKCFKSLTRSSWPSKKAKCGPKVTNVASVPQDKACKGSDLDLNSVVNDDPFLGPALFVSEIDLQAPVSPDNKESTRPSAESDNNQTSAEKESPSSLVDIDSLQKQTNPKNTVGDDQAGMDSYNSSRNNLENRGRFLATEEEEQERTAAEAIVDISSSSAHTLLEISTNVACENLHWFAKIASSVIEDPKSEFGLSTSGCPSSNGTDYFEVMTLHLTEMKAEDHYTAPKSNIANQETTISSLAFGRPRRGPGRQRKRQHQDFQHNVLPSLASLLRSEVSEDLQTIGGLMEANGTKRDNKCAKNKAKNGVSASGRRRLCSSTPSKVIDALTAPSNNFEEKRVINWGTITRRRRGPRRIPAANFQLILSQV